MVNTFGIMKIYIDVEGFIDNKYIMSKSHNYLESFKKIDKLLV